MKTIAQGWATYVERVVPAEASDTQIMETKRAFYAGAHQTLCTMGHVSDTMGEDDAVTAIESMHKEGEAFAEDIKNGKA